MILHIGLHRTGTTYIQQTVLPSILPDGFVTPRRDRHAVGSYLMRLKSSIDLGQAQKDKIKIISREGISGGPCFTNRFDHLDIVSAFCGAPLVVISYRNPVDLAKSLYLHCYTHNLHNRTRHASEPGVEPLGTLTYAEYYAVLEKTGKLDLKTLIEKWRAVGDVRVINLDLQKDDPLYYFNCFRRFLGQAPVSGLPQHHAHNFNATVDVETELGYLNTRREAAGKTRYTRERFDEDVDVVSSQIRKTDDYAFYSAYDFYRPHPAAQAA